MPATTDTVIYSLAYLEQPVPTLPIQRLARASRKSPVPTTIHLLGRSEQRPWES